MEMFHFSIPSVACADLKSKGHHGFETGTTENGVSFDWISGILFC